MTKSHRLTHSDAAARNLRPLYSASTCCAMPLIEAHASAVASVRPSLIACSSPRHDATNLLKEESCCGQMTELAALVTLSFSLSSAAGASIIIKAVRAASIS